MIQNLEIEEITEKITRDMASNIQKINILTDNMGEIIKIISLIIKHQIIMNLKTNYYFKV
jgi:hypothetical protein